MSSSNNHRIKLSLGLEGRLQTLYVRELRLQHLVDCICWSFIASHFWQLFCQYSSILCSWKSFFFCLVDGIQEKKQEVGVALVGMIQVNLVVVVESPLFHSTASVDKRWLSSLLSSHPNSSVHTDPCLQEERLNLNYQVMQAIISYLMSDGMTDSSLFKYISEYFHVTFSHENTMMQVSLAFSDNNL